MTDSATYIKQQFDSNGKAGPQPSPNVGVGDNSAALAALGEILGGPKVAPGTCGLQSDKGKAPPAKGPIVQRWSFAEALDV
jgi:hypothetical protein